MFYLIYDEKAIDFLGELPQDIRQRIFSKIEASTANPHRFFSRLKGRSDYRMRVGDYRVIADIDVTAQTIKIRVIGHRKNIYKS